MKKDIIYIDVEDDITAIIEKLKASKAKIVALVPPKRSTVLTSVVNTKLLKRAAEDSDKRVVLITNDSALLTIAGGLGLHVAKNLQSKPYLPEAPETPVDEDNVIEGDLSDLDPKAAIGDLDEAATATGATTKDDDEKPGDSNGLKEKGKKLFKIPNFERFRFKVILGAVGVVLLAIAWWWAFWIAPAAEVSIVAQTSQLDTAIDYTVNKNIETSDLEAKVLKGTQMDMKKTVTEDFVATGEDNVGNKAKGTMTVQNCSSSLAITVSAGTFFVSSSGLEFTSDSAVDAPGGVFDVISGCTAAGTVDVAVTATAAGDNYNLASTSYTTGIAGISGFGGQMSGGTTVIKKVISKDDFDKAKANLATRDYSKEKQELAALFGDGLVGMEDTFKFTIGKATSAPAVGEEGERAIMSAEITFTEIGVARSDLETMLAQFQEPRIDANTQSIYDDGLGSASYELQKDLGKGKYSFRLRAIGTVGPNISTETLAQQIEGKRFSEAKSIVDAIPGVVSSEIKLSPFWVNKVPSVSKTTINVEVSEQNLQ